jgi:hypothetical protein
MYPVVALLIVSKEQENVCRLVSSTLASAGGGSTNSNRWASTMWKAIVLPLPLGLLAVGERTRTRTTMRVLTKNRARELGVWQLQCWCELLQPRFTHSGCLLSRSDRCDSKQFGVAGRI